MRVITNEGYNLEMNDTLYYGKLASSKKLVNFKFYNVIKRGLDILFSTIGLLLLIPIMLIVKVSYVLNKDYDSIFFKQERIGKDGKLFVLYKFRTMVSNADKILEKILLEDIEKRKEYELNKKLKDDPRITKAGKLLRKLSIDEMPQFINILKGEMTLIGNRPYLPREKEDMGILYHEIIKTKPGLSGYWQTSGRNDVSFKYRTELEAYYSKNMNFKLDLKIFINTFKTLFKGL